MKSIQNFPALREQMSCAITECQLKEVEVRYYVGKILSTGIYSNSPMSIVDFSENLGFSSFKDVQIFLSGHPEYTWARAQQVDDEYYFRYHMIFVPTSTGEFTRRFIPLLAEDFAQDGSTLAQICDICSMCSEAIRGNIPPKQWVLREYKLTNTEAESLLRHLETLKYLAKLSH